MTAAQGRLDVALPKLRAVFDKLQAIEGRTDINWQALLELRERADPLTDDTFHRGYLVGVADSFGVSVAELIEVIKTKPRRRRIVQVRRAG